MIRQLLGLRRALWLLPAAVLVVTTAAVRGTGAAAADAPALDSAVRATLDEIDAHGLNRATGGLFINWSVDTPARANLPDGSPARHDELTDLRHLLNMAWYERRHPGDTSQAATLARLAPPTRATVAHYSSDKGWVYWQFLQLAALTGDRFWTDRAQAFATHLAATVDPLLGVVHGHIAADGRQPACSDGFRVDHDLEGGLALVDAGRRFGDPTWTLVGLREAVTVIVQGFDTSHRLFNHTVCGSTPADRAAKVGEQADEILALVDTGTATGIPLFTNLATQMLDGLVANATGLHDTASGGFFFEYDLGTGTVSAGYKETRQLTLLTALHHLDAVDGGRYAALEAEMTRVALSMLQRGSVSGYPYRETATFGFYPGERYITTEAGGIGAEALQTVLDTTAPAAPAPLLPLPPLLPLTSPATAPPVGAPTVALPAVPAPRAPAVRAAPVRPAPQPAAPEPVPDRLAPRLPAPLPGGPGPVVPVPIP
jgi:hypothetical protein